MLLIKRYDYSSPGITSELEHLVDAGVGALWMSPIFKSPMIDFGYDVSDFYDIHEEYGTMQDFDELVQTAHDMGKGIVLLINLQIIPKYYEAKLLRIFISVFNLN